MKTDFNYSKMYDTIVNEGNRYIQVYKALPVIAECFNKYVGKSYGPKTKEKIRLDILNKTGLSCYIDEYRYFDDMVLYDQAWDCYDNKIIVNKKEFDFDKTDVRPSKILINNKIQCMNVGSLEIVNAKLILEVDDITAALDRLYNRYNQLKESIEACYKAYNELKPESAAPLFYPLC